MSLLDQFPAEKLTKEQEISLTNRHRFNSLVLGTMREAVAYARTCSNGKIEDSELVSICYDAMLKTAKRFDPRRGYRFFAFCKPRIRGALQDYWVAREPVRNAHTVPLEPVPTHSPDPEGWADTDNPATPTQEPEFEAINFREQFRKVSDIMARHCTDRERAILIMVFTHSFTFEEAGDLFGISRQMVQNISAKAIEKIKNVLDKENEKA